MRLPDKVKVLGYNYNVEYYHDNQTGRFGSCDINTLTLRINANKDREQMESTLLHEIIEAIDFHLGLELTEKQIMGLEAGLYAVLKENRLKFGG